ncbi:MAG TPA: hypothetical protein VFL42_08425 [Terriglobales bacterium]|nr:hypothetical protein [Terriglobales bacterium]
MKKDAWHAGVSTRQVRIGDGAGVAAAVMIPGSVAVLLTGSPDFWLFPVGATALGLAISAVRSYFRSTRIAPLSLHQGEAASHKERL